MKKIIPFNKDITFKGNIKEIISIALDDDLTLKGENKIVGNFYIKGEYREENEALTLEKYSYKLPVEIEISDQYDTYDATIDIDDFMYEVNKNILSVSIKVKIDNIEKKESINVINDREELKDEIEPNKDIDLDDKFEEKKEIIGIPELKENLIEKEIDKKEEQKEVINKLDKEMNDRLEKEAKVNKIINDNSNNNSNSFSLIDKNQLNADNNKYLTYFVYKVKEEDTINYIKEKYKVSVDDLSDYNDLEKFGPGVKLIIPSLKK